MPEPRSARPYALHVGDLHIRRNVAYGACRGTRVCAAPIRELRRCRWYAPASTGVPRGIDPAGRGRQATPRRSPFSGVVPDSSAAQSV